VGAGLLEVVQDSLRPASAAALPTLEFLADLLRDYLQSYLVATLTLEDMAKGGPMDRKAFVRAALETGRLELLSGRLDAAEALSRTTLENALAYLLDQGLLEERERKLYLGPEVATAEQREALRAELLAFTGK
jgi:glycerol-3-phosphate O-acyltransferase